MKMMIISDIHGSYEDLKKAISVFDEENMDKLGSYEMRNRIDFLLWDTHKTHKREFNTCWNKSWKSKLKTLENHLL